MKYQEYKNLNYAHLSEKILNYWKQNNIFEQSIAAREGNETFTFYEGPPSANGTPGIHHVMARTIKDIFCRYKTLQGFQVKRKGGWDTHGLPVELQVEKALGITKDDIGKKISIAEYNQKCKETVMKYTHQWNELTEKMGYWVDLDHPYITYENNYIESVWHLLKKLYEKNLLYKGYTIQPYSPAAGTGLSSHELNQPGAYRNIKDTSIVAQFRVVYNEKSDKVNIESPPPTLSANGLEKESYFFKEGTGDLYFLAWTTTPWTLPANAALAVGKNIAYVKVQTFNPYTFKPVRIILAKDLLDKYFNEKQKDASFINYKPGDKLIPYTILAEYKGEELVGIEYEPLFTYVIPEKPAFRVILGDFVSTEDGTGIVHISPTFGSDDYRVAMQNDIPPIMVKDEEGNLAPIVNKKGQFVKEITDYAGLYVKNYDNQDEDDPNYKSVDVIIAIRLKEENKAFKVEKYEHSYPHCWRTDKPVLYYPLDSWFIKTTAVKDKLIALNNTIHWQPESTGTGRFGNWLENLVDWNLSRSRYWGTPLPIWRTEDGKEEVCIGSLEELKTQVSKANTHFQKDQSLLEEKAKQILQKQVNLVIDKMDLHRPYVDEVIFVSSTGKPMYREADLIDVWFDSGAMPYAQWHYPFENKEIFEKNFPADFISEGVDQTRGWFFTLHAIAGMLFDSVAFKNVVSTGLVLDKNGDKMSKRKGNVVDPFETLAKYGADTTRWYMMENSYPWDNLKFNLEGIEEIQRGFFGTLQNTYTFFALYANLDNFTYAEKDIPLAERTESDRWILSKLNTLIAEVEKYYEAYDPTNVTRAIQTFVSDDVSNWYVRLNRKRFWKSDYNPDKIAAYQTLYTCLEVVAKLISPIAPFYAEQLYLDLNKTSQREKLASIHLTQFPKVDQAQIDQDLEEKMNLAQRISSLVHSIRKIKKIRVRQPLLRVLIPVLNEKQKLQIQAVEDLILTEVNVKKIEYIDDTSGILIKSAKPNFKRLGQLYGAKMKDVAGMIQQFKQEDIAKLEKEGVYEIKLGDEYATLTLEDILIESKDIEGWSVANDNGVTVALDITLTEELKKEGIARDLVNRIQNLRKDAGFEVQDKIKIFVKKQNELLDHALANHKTYICTETQAQSLDIVDELAEGTEIDMEDFKLYLKIEVTKRLN